jgi:hypothetical protein
MCKMLLRLIEFCDIFYLLSRKYLCYAPRFMRMNNHFVFEELLFVIMIKYIL